MADAERVRQIYNRRARDYSRRRRASLDGLRAHLFARARGDVLELGVGAGVTFGFYPHDLASLTAVAQVSLLACSRAEWPGSWLPSWRRPLDDDAFPLLAWRSNVNDG